MANIRISEIAKELQADAKEILAYVNEHGVEAKTVQKSLEADMEEKVRKAFGKKKEEEAPRPKKKKRLIAVFHPQNASSKEGRNFRQNGTPPRGAERRPRGPEQRAPKPAQRAVPLVKVPRAHPVERDTEILRPNKQPAAQKPKRPAEIPAVEETAAAAPAVEETVRVAEVPEVRPAAAAEQTADAVKPAAKAPAETAPAEQVPAGKVPAEKAPAAKAPSARPAAPERRQEAGGRRPARPDRPERPERQDRNAPRGQRPDRGQARPGRPTDSAGARGDSRQRNAAPGRPAPQQPVPADASRKQARGSHAKDKDKRELRENKFSNDRKGGRGQNQRQMIPKALQQKTAHRPKEDKKEAVTEVSLPEKMTIRELAEAMKMQPSQIVKDLFMKGEMYTVNQEIDFDKAEEIAMEYDIVAEKMETVDVIEELLKEEEEDESKMVSRPPVVCVMGHVDHGKTSLLDAIRHAHVTDREAGGITQNIGAYSVRINDRKITFLDTPGHEAFTAMRMRGANSTDIAILVVAADDGVMPQTVEAIHHAKAAGVEIVVAINKIDKPGANIDRVKQELIEHELVPVDWGGSTEFVPVSAKTKEGIDDLLETVLLTADIMELKANPKRKARGLVLEAKLDKGKGPVANILVQKGTLKVGDYIACGAASGKVRAMMDENGKRVKEARPSTPVEVLGLNDVPNAGEILVALDSDKEAKDFAATFVTEGRNKMLEETKSRMSLDALFGQLQEGTLKELELVVKADVQGSLEALKQSLLKLSNDEVLVRIIHSGVGAISESDITLAAASNAIVIGFNVRPDAVARTLAEHEKIDVRLYDVIYQVIDDIEAAMKGMLEPIYEEKITGHAEVRQLFKASGVGTIAGSYVLDGVIQRGCKVRISRDGKQIFEGNLASLKRFKDDVKEVKAGYECGLVFDGFGELRELDQVEAYTMVEVPRS